MKPATILSVLAIIVLTTVGSTTLRDFSFISKFCIVGPLLYIIWLDLSKALCIDQFDIAKEIHRRISIPSWMNILTGYSTLLTGIALVGFLLPESEEFKAFTLHVTTNLVNVDIRLNILTSIVAFNILVLFIPYALFLPWKIAILQCDPENSLGRLGYAMCYLHKVTALALFTLATSSAVIGITFL